MRAAIAAALLSACGAAEETPAAATPAVALTPTEAVVPPGGEQTFVATATGVAAPSVSWSVKEGASGGSITQNGLYSAPSTLGTYTVVALETTSGVRGEATVTVAVAQPTRPTITSFSATPAALSAPGTVTLSWEVSGADAISIDNGVGAVSGSSRSVTVASSTVFTLTASNTAGTVSAMAAAVVGGNPATATGRHSRMLSPTDGETFIAPTGLRLIASAYDANNWDNNNKRNALSVTFYVDDTPVLTVPEVDSEFYLFKGYATGITAGKRRVWARATFEGGAVLDSVPVIVDVQAVPSYARTINLSADASISGSTLGGQSLIGTASGRVRVNGNGHGITSTGSAPLVMSYVDFVNVGSSGYAIDLATSAGLTVENCTFDSVFETRFTVSGSAPASVRGNTWRSNTRFELGQLPHDAGGGSRPAITFAGNSTAQKVFQGNNIGAGTIYMISPQNWLIGGDAAADENVFIGPRIGIELDNPSNVTIRRNYSNHLYTGAWSQAENMHLGVSASVLLEHNVIAGGSWPIREVGGEVRYNLVHVNNEGWAWIGTSIQDAPDAYLHHNVFIGSQGTGRAGIYSLYGDSFRALNNTFDGLGDAQGSTVLTSGGTATVRSNLFYRAQAATGEYPVKITGGSLSADYNLFWQSKTPYYSDSRAPANDVAGDPLLTTSGGFEFIDRNLQEIWRRTFTTRDVLKRYRARYAPAPGSPAIDAGDPALGAGNDIGAVGGGTPHAADLFGK